jgi:hypothetical protein
MTKPVRDYYVYRLDDADSVPRYIGKGRGRRAAYHEAKVRALLANPKTKRATRVHRLMLKDGRKFDPEIVSEELTQREAYDLRGGANPALSPDQRRRDALEYPLRQSGMERYPTRRLARGRCDGGPLLHPIDAMRRDCAACSPTRAGEKLDAQIEATAANLARALDLNSRSNCHD